MSIKANKALFIGIGFYDYEIAIKRELENIGFEVDYFTEVKKKNFISRTLNKIVGQTNDFEDQSDVIAANCREDYDLVFVIKCEYLSTRALDVIKEKNPHAKYILYLWDSMQRINNIRTKVEYFDKVFSFDRQDCESNKYLIFNASFYRREFDELKTKKPTKFKLFHLGWFHSDRLNIIFKASEFCKKNNLENRLMLYTGVLNFTSQLISNKLARKMVGSFILRPISFKSYLNYVKNADVILDIHHPNQTGLTMRPIEMMAIDKKLITTNADIINYDFYDKRNILVIDRNNPIFSIDFFNNEYKKIDPKIKELYSINSWLKRMVLDKP